VADLGRSAKFMKTPTLIVRLIGIYLLATSIIGLVQIGRQASMQESTQMAMQQQMQEAIKFQTIHGLPTSKMPSIPENPMISDMQVYLWIEIVVGLAASAFAGFLARLLTFDADSRSDTDEFSDRLLRR
jgi:hypothetical protein